MTSMATSRTFGAQCRLIAIAKTPPLARKQTETAAASVEWRNCCPRMGTDGDGPGLRIAQIAGWWAVGLCRGSERVGVTPGDQKRAATARNGRAYRGKIYMC